MSTPISVDVPHRLGTAEAKRRIGANIGGLASHLPTGAEIRSAWEGDKLKLDIGLMGQELPAELDVRDALVRVTVQLPPALAFFGKAIEAALRRSAPDLLEDRGKR